MWKILEKTRNKKLENKLKSYVINNRFMPKDYLEASRIQSILGNGAGSLSFLKER
ncbi:MAG: hypothetical protein QW328_07725 [Nitrososphaerota archaeon]